MPLHDHFQGPMSEELPADTLHSAWAGEIARRLNSRWLRRPFRALEHRHSPEGLEIDVAVKDRGDAAAGSNGVAVATLPVTWAPPAALAVGPLVVPEGYQVRIFDGPGTWRMVGAVEIISPSNKNTPDRRDAFVSKCAAYLHAGVSLAIIDIVTERRSNLHHALLDRIRLAEGRLPGDPHLYAAAYRPARREGRTEVEVWAEPCLLGAELPTMPLRLTDDLFVPIEFELAYLAALESHGIE